MPVCGVHAVLGCSCRRSHPDTWYGYYATVCFRIVIAMACKRALLLVHVSAGLQPLSCPNTKTADQCCVSYGGLNTAIPHCSLPGPTSTIRAPVTDISAITTSLSASPDSTSSGLEFCGSKSSEQSHASSATPAAVCAFADTAAAVETSDVVHSIDNAKDAGVLFGVLL